MATTRYRMLNGGAPGVPPMGLAVATTEVEEDINGGPLGDVVGGSGSGHHRS
jgi:hypothetical protein